MVSRKSIFALSVIACLLLCAFKHNKNKNGFVHNSDDFTYAVTDNTSITITGYTGATGPVVIPSTILRMPVSRIGVKAFLNKTGITGVTIPDSVTRIGERAFSGCTGLAVVHIPNSVTSIGQRAFENCTGLSAITIPGSVMKIGDFAFENCTRLSSAYLLVHGPMTMGTGVFNNCASSFKVYYKMSKY